MLAIKNNLMAENAARHLGKSYDALAKSVERLSSGLRINSAKDDAAGLAVRELIRADIATLKQGARNAQDGISMLQAMEGAVSQIDEILVRMKELAEQAATGSYSSAQRTIMNNEFVEMSNEIDRIVENTEFNGIKMLNSALANAISIHVGSPETIDVDKYDMTASGLGVKSTLGVKESWTLNRGVAAAGDIVLTAAEIGSKGSADRFFEFKFSGDGYLADSVYHQVDLSAYTATGITMNQLVQAINDTVATDVGASSAWAVATPDWDSEYQVYRLKLTSDQAADVTFIVTGTSSTSAMDATGDFAKYASGAAGTGINLNTNATGALTAIDAAIETKDASRAALGYKMNRLESTVSVLGMQTENLLAAESRISDVDVATEVAAMTRNQVLAQAGVAMLAQAGMLPQMALQLLG